MAASDLNNVTHFGLSSTPVFRPLNEIGGKSRSAAGTPPRCSDQVFERVFRAILPAPQTPPPTATYPSYTPAESMMQLPPCILLYRFDRTRELKAILTELAHDIRPTESEETQMYKHLFEALETQTVRTYYEFKTRQLSRAVYQDSDTVFGRKSAQQPVSTQSLNPSRRGASTPSTPTPARSGLSKLPYVRSASSHSTDNELAAPSLPSLTAQIVKEVYFKVQDQRGARRPVLTPPQTPSKRKARDQKDRIVADRANKKIKEYLTDQFQASSLLDPVTSSDKAYVASSPRSLHISQLPKRSTPLPKTPRKPRATRLAYPASYSQTLPASRQFSHQFLQSPLLSPAVSSLALRQPCSTLLQSPLPSPTLPPLTCRWPNSLLQSPVSMAPDALLSTMATPLVPFMPQNAMMHGHSFGPYSDFNCALLPAPLQVPATDLLNNLHMDSFTAGNAVDASFANECSLYFYNKGYEYAQACLIGSHGLSQSSLWMHGQPQPNAFLGSGNSVIPLTSAQDADFLSL
ncbi:hypothetical protein BJ741DRAFT_614437 [Chytriomyces cf. hyalinus JEL632]|nr:hypothetical protein BJ741DRAFT_614437 [Chytriomyces cf. hyalinus JEL632]